MYRSVHWGKKATTSQTHGTTQENKFIRTGFSSPFESERQGHCFEHSKVHILDREDYWLKEESKSMYVNIE